MKKLIGDKAFYKMVLGIAVPIMLQNGISNFVGLLDNIMIGRVGTEQMSGVSIVNQLMFVFILCLFGVTGGAGILGAQYFGQKNMEGVRDVFRIKLVSAFIILVIGVAIFLGFNNELISMYLKEGSESGDLLATLKYGKEYLYVMLLGMPPLAMEMSYSSTLRESGETKVSMNASFIAVFVNLFLNYILIFGKFGAPVLGVVGAAIATVISRYIQMTYVIVWTHTHKEKTPYMTGVYKKFRIPFKLVGKVAILAAPLMLNETLWSAGMAAVNAAYAQRGLASVAAVNIQSTIYNIFNIMYIALGDAVAIIVGQKLGSGDVEKAKETANKIIAFSVFCGFCCGLLMLCTSKVFPMVYNTTDEVRNLASVFIIITGLCMPIHAFLHAVYFAIRSGGKTVITFLFDSAYLWVVSVPVAFALAKYTTLIVTTMFLICQLVDLVKVTIGLIIYKSGIWANNLTSE